MIRWPRSPEALSSGGREDWDTTRVVGGSLALTRLDAVYHAP